MAGVYWFREKNVTDFGDVFTISPAPGVAVPLVL